MGSFFLEGGSQLLNMHQPTMATAIPVVYTAIHPDQQDPLQLLTGDILNPTLIHASPNDSIAMSTFSLDIII